MIDEPEEKKISPVMEKANELVLEVFKESFQKEELTNEQKIVDFMTSIAQASMRVQFIANAVLFDKILQIEKDSTEGQDVDISQEKLIDGADTLSSGDKD